MKRIGILHGAIKNSGDYLIYHRGKTLLEHFLGNNIELVPIARWEPIQGEFDLLVILGGPIISRTLRLQPKIIERYLNKRDIPVICVGLGISGEFFSSYENYFVDESSIRLWKKIYDSSNLFSVRDKETQKVLEKYNIKTILTGCPALFELGYLNDYFNEINKLEYHFNNNETAITIPNLGGVLNRNFIISLFFIFYLNIKLSVSGLKRNIILIYQHGIESLPNRIIKITSELLGNKTVDASYKSPDEIKSLRDVDLHIGSRLHTNIFFLSLGKPSYLLDIDNRTSGFLKTINVPHDSFTIIGIIKLVNKLAKDIKENKMLGEIRNTQVEIVKLFISMRSFLIEIKKFILKL